MLPETGIHDTFHISELIEYSRIKYNVNASLSSRRGVQGGLVGEFNTFLNIPPILSLLRLAHGSEDLRIPPSFRLPTPRNSTSTRVLEGG